MRNCLFLSHKEKQAGIKEVLLASIFHSSRATFFLFIGVEKTSEDRWYVLRDLARPNAKTPAYKQLQAMPEMKDCVFVPLKQHVFMKFKKREVCFIPYMPDLIFVHKSREELDPIVRKIKLLQYRYVRGGKQFEAMSVRAQDFGCRSEVTLSKRKNVLHVGRE